MRNGGMIYLYMTVEEKNEIFTCFHCLHSPMRPLGIHSSRRGAIAQISYIPAGERQFQLFTGEWMEKKFRVEEVLLNAPNGKRDNVYLLLKHSMAHRVSMDRMECHLTCGVGENTILFAASFERAELENRVQELFSRESRGELIVFPLP